MDQITDLRELLKHELKDLYSAETQIIDAMPAMIETARNPQLKKALSDHLRVTRDQKKRLEQIEELLNYENIKADEDGGFFANLFRSAEGEQHCKAMEGIIKEGENIMSEDMEPEVMDAAIIAAAQKIEHYEIGSYGTARAYAEQMGLTEVEKLLRQTLDEEYFADDSLTVIAVNKVNLKAESGNGTMQSQKPAARKKAAPKKAGSNKDAGKKSASKKSAAKKTATKKSASKKSAPKKAAAKKTSKKAAPKKSAAKKSSAKKSVSKKSSAKKSGTKRPAVKKAISKKSASKRAAPKKSAAKKAGSRKAVSKKSAKKGSKKGSRR